MAILASDPMAAETRPLSKWLLAWALALGAVLLLFVFRERLAFAVSYPADAVLPLADFITVIMQWLKANISGFTRLITTVLGVPLNFALDLLAKNFKFGHGLDAVTLPRLSWFGICAAVFLAGRAFGGNRLAFVAGGLFFYVVLFGKWTSAMLTLALISI
eukprot:gene13888-18397_t